jgi:hypothetical protein
MILSRKTLEAWQRSHLQLRTLYLRRQGTVKCVPKMYDIGSILSPSLQDVMDIYKTRAFVNMYTEIAPWYRSRKKKGRPIPTILLHLLCFWSSKNNRKGNIPIGRLPSGHPSLKRDTIGWRAIAIMCMNRTERILFPDIQERRITWLTSSSFDTGSSCYPLLLIIEQGPVDR